MAPSCGAVGIDDLVKFLIKYSALLDRWYEFCECLGSETQDVKRWDRGIKTCSLSYYEVFSEMFKLWVLKHDGRRISHVCDILLTMGLGGVSGELLGSFGHDDLFKTPANHPVNQDQELSGRKALEIRNHVLRYEQEIKWPISHLQRQKIPAKNFTGRKPELKILHSHFKANDNLILLCGIGGIGKTELCKKFVDDIRYHKIFSFSTAFISDISRIWLHGDTFETLKQSIFEVGKHLGVPYGSELSPIEYFDDIVNLILKNSRRLLVVIDNVDVKYDEMLKVVKIAKDYSQIFVMVTSRNSMVLDNAGITLKLDVLEEKDALKILQRSNLGPFDSNSENLCALVQYYPLALQQAVAYIKQQRTHPATLNYRVSDYVREFERKKIALLGHSLNTIEHDYSMTTLLTWNMTIEKMSEDAVEILKILAHLDPDGIETSILNQIYKNMRDVGFNHGFAMVHSYSLVKVHNGIASIHRLVQEVIRIHTKHPDYLPNLFDAAFTAFTKLPKVATPRFRVNYLQHLNTLSKHCFNCGINTFNRFCEVLEFLLKHNRFACAVKCTMNDFKNIVFPSDLTMARKLVLLEKLLLWSIVSLDQSVSNQSLDQWVFVEFDHNSYLPLLDVSLHLAQKYYSWSEEMTFKFKIKLARNLLENKSWGGNGFRTTQCISLCEKIIDSEYVDEYLTAFETIFMANKIKSSDSRSKIKVVQRLLQSKIDKTGTNHKGTIKIKRILAELHEKGGKLEISLELFEQIRDFAVDFDMNKDDVKQCRWNVARVKLRLENVAVLKPIGELTDGENSLKDLKILLTCFIDILGENDEFTLQLKNKTAFLLYQQGMCSESKSLIEEVLRSNDLNAIIVAINTIRHILGNIEYAGENYVELIELLENVLVFQTNSLGYNHKDIVTTKDVLATSLQCFGQFNRALELRVEQLYYYEMENNKNRHLSRYNSEVLKNNKDIIETLRTKIGFSLEKLETVLNIYAKILGEDHQFTVKLKIDIARNIIFDDNERCISLCEEVRDSRCDAECKEACSLLFLEVKKKGDNYNEVKLKKLLEVKKFERGENYSNEVRLIEFLAEAIEKVGNFRLAVQLFQYVRSTALEYNWSEKCIRYLHIKIIKLKLHLGDYANVTNDNIHGDFNKFKEYFEEFSLKELEQLSGCRKIL